MLLYLNSKEQKNGLLANHTDTKKTSAYKKHYKKIPELYRSGIFYTHSLCKQKYFRAGINSLYVIR